MFPPSDLRRLAVFRPLVSAAALGAWRSSGARQTSSLLPLTGAMGLSVPWLCAAPPLVHGARPGGVAGLKSRARARARAHCDGRTPPQRPRATLWASLLRAWAYARGGSARIYLTWRVLRQALALGQLCVCHPRSPRGCRRPWRAASSRWTMLRCNAACATRLRHILTACSPELDGLCQMRHWHPPCSGGWGFCHFPV